MLVKIHTAALQGIEALPVSIEIHVSRGIRFSIVGLPDNAVRESHERIASALQMNGMNIPRKQVIVNLSPANIRKEGTGYDLPMTVGLMIAGEYIPIDAVENSLFIGELSLDGSLQSVKGVLSVALLCKEMGLSRLYVPYQNAMEASMVDGLEIFAVHHLKELKAHLMGEKVLHPFVAEDFELLKQTAPITEDFCHVKGQQTVKRAVEIACSGGHNLIMIGPPGAGKTMIAKCIPGILPPLTKEEAIESTRIHSVAGKTCENAQLLLQRPFRSPHHSISSVAMIGGGSLAQPGEISLAHRGVLYLDELPEFPRSVLEVLRQPLEERKVHISRSRYSVDFPADFMLIASMNPCPCGYYNHPSKPCVCGPGQVKKYLNRISGPLLDRFDIQVEIAPLDYEEISASSVAENSAQIRERVLACRERQAFRFRREQGVSVNAQMTQAMLSKYAQVDKAGSLLLKNAMEKLQLSARAYSRILKVARSIADIECCENIQAHHLAEAIGYRSLDRENWGSG
ncbi:MAG: YifB family Mg chelatase-like AAA ATPase [Bacteroidales bacterium]|nr:YifB family Mg chelatase-like AAA ATPase [Bacteroidales bacterium]